MAPSSAVPKRLAGSRFDLTADFERASIISRPRSSLSRAPGRPRLTDDQVYAVTAWILAEAKVIGPGAEMSAKTLPRVEMPNRGGFLPDRRLDVRIYR